MNRLLRALLDFDRGNFAVLDGIIVATWYHPFDRDRNDFIDVRSIRILLRRGYLEQNGRWLCPTARGWVLIHAYRPNAWRQEAIYPNYTNWLTNADRFQRYITLYGENYR